MASRSKKRKTSKKPTKKATKKAATQKPAGKKVAGKKAKQSPARSSSRRSAAKTTQHVPTLGLDGWITHTDLGSHDPAATREWCTRVLGWSFRPSFPMPDGSEYLLFHYSEQGGGGIHSVSPTEPTVSIPYVHVADAAAAFEKAIAAGAEMVSAPNRVMEGVTIAVVRAPGGVTIGLSGP
jgi:predicted enzyme related to lactoylglutathione lyase